MKFQWYDLPQLFRSVIIINIIRLKSEMNTIDAGTLLWSLSELDCALDQEPSYLLDAIFTISLLNLDKMKSQEIARTIWGYSGTGVSWNMLPAAVCW